MSATATSLDQLIVNSLRFLSVDAVEAANSGHPGLPLGAAPMVATLYGKVMKFHPGRPDWFNRDRFVLSAGHGSALLYSALHVFGYDLPLAELKRFRQLGSKTPGHPEVGLTAGVECTTGPLGQGMGNAVGFALAEQWLANRYNQGTHKVIDHFTYAVVSDGDLMEGIAQEAASLAGHLGLGKLIALYDSNDISLDGPCEKAYTEDVAGKFTAMGWSVTTVSDGNDTAAIESAVRSAQEVTDKPSLIIVRTVIGFGSPLAGTSKSHGAPLGAENVTKTRAELGWNHGPFELPAEVSGVAAEATKSGEALVSLWEESLSRYRAEHPQLAAELDLIVAGKLPSDAFADLDNLSFEGGKVATRDAGKSALGALANKIPWIVGGTADLASSTKAVVPGGDFSEENPTGRNVWFGVREHAMGAIVNGMSLHGLRGFSSTFLVFSDYMRGSIRLASLSHIPHLFVFSHDSVFVGEDGPTHQPIEHVSSLRLIPGLRVYRPADALETAACYREAVQSAKASAMILTRQNVPVLTEFHQQIQQGVAKGGYILREADGASVALLATGSEVSFALSVADALAGVGIAARVVSIPCLEVFAEQSPEYRASVIPPGMKRISLEAGRTGLWGGWSDLQIGIDRFGESAPGDQVYAEMGFTVEKVVAHIKDLLG